MSPACSEPRGRAVGRAVRRFRFAAGYALDTPAPSLSPRCRLPQAPPAGCARRSRGSSGVAASPPGPCARGVPYRFGAASQDTRWIHRRRRRRVAATAHTKQTTPEAAPPAAVVQEALTRSTARPAALPHALPLRLVPPKIPPKVPAQRPGSAARTGAPGLSCALQRAARALPSQYCLRGAEEWAWAGAGRWQRHALTALAGVGAVPRRWRRWREPRAARQVAPQGRCRLRRPPRTWRRQSCRRVPRSAPPPASQLSAPVLTAQLGSRLLQASKQRQQAHRMQRQHQQQAGRQEERSAHLALAAHSSGVPSRDAVCNPAARVDVPGSYSPCSVDTGHGGTIETVQRAQRRRQRGRWRR